MTETNRLQEVALKFGAVLNRFISTLHKLRKPSFMISMISACQNPNLIFGEAFQLLICAWAWGFCSTCLNRCLWWHYEMWALSTKKHNWIHQEEYPECVLYRGFAKLAALAGESICCWCYWICWRWTLSNGWWNLTGGMRELQIIKLSHHSRSIQFVMSTRKQIDWNLELLHSMNFFVHCKNFKSLATWVKINDLCLTEA